MKYECVCGYVYDPEVGDPDNGIAPGTAFEDLPEDWVCPVCGLRKRRVHRDLTQQTSTTRRNAPACPERFFLFISCGFPKGLSFGRKFGSEVPIGIDF